MCVCVCVTERERQTDGVKEIQNEKGRSLLNHCGSIAAVPYIVH